MPFIFPTDDKLISPVVWHRDLHKGNIFVQNGKISSILDWQSVWIGPLLLRARSPLLVDYKGEILLRLPENLKEFPVEEQDCLRYQVQRSVLVYLYENNTREWNPALDNVLRLPQGKTIDQLVEFAGMTWDADILPFRECLIRLERRV